MMTEKPVGGLLASLDVADRAAGVAERLAKNTTAAQYNQITGLILLAALICLAVYELLFARPALVKDMQDGHAQGRQEFKHLNDSNLNHFESIIDNQAENQKEARKDLIESHERVVQMLTGAKLKVAGAFPVDLPHDLGNKTN